MWIGLLFSVMSISAFLQQQDAGALNPYALQAEAALETYRTLTIHCLVGRYISDGICNQNELPSNQQPRKGQMAN
jgi:hypothetical protein